MAQLTTGLYWCGNQWGYTPVGTVVNIPGGFCNAPTDLKAEVYAQFATLSWKAPHDYIKFVLEYRIGVGAWTTVDVVGQSYKLTLTPETEYQWRVKTVCELAPLRESVYAAGQNFTTGKAVASCAAVSTVTVTYMGTFYRLSWASTGAQYYTVELRRVGINIKPITRIFNVQGTYLDLTDLHEGADYEARVIAHCENITETPEPSPWVQWSTASLTCPLPGVINYTRASTSIVIGWGSAGPGYTYNIYLDNVLVVTNYPLTTFTFSGLTANTEYTIEVRTNCGNGYSDKQQVIVKTLPAPCNAPTGLQVTGQTATSVTVDWTPGAGIASQQIILNNGTPIALGAGINTYTFNSLPSGSSHKIVVRSICASSVSIDAVVQVTLDGCAAPTNLVLTPSSESIAISWAPVSNAFYYRVVVTKVTGSIVVYDQKNVTTSVNVSGLLTGTQYLVEVYALCGQFEGSLTESTAVSDTTTTTVLPNCESATITNSVIGQTTLDITFNFASGRTSGFITAKLLKVSDDSLVATQTLTDIGTVSFTGLTFGTGYKVFIYHEDQPGLNKCIPVVITTLTTTAECLPPSALTATLQTNDTEILVAATASPSAPATYQLEYQLYGSTEWVSEGAVTLPHTITGIEPGKYKVRLRSNCPSSVSAWVESAYTCPKPVIEQVAVKNNTVSISWKPLLGVELYKIEITSLVGGLATYDSTTNFITIQNLSWNSNFTAIVKAVCNTILGTGTDSDQFGFATGPEVVDEPGTCPQPTFTAFMQDCSVTDPKDPPPDNGGTCGIEAMDWELISAIFVPITDDPPNDMFLEATFRIPNSLPNGDLGAMPGGIMGKIKDACLPQSSATMEVEVLAGGTFDIGSGTLATNGNVTVSASYTSNGTSHLIVRLKGNYNKV